MNAHQITISIAFPLILIAAPAIQAQGTRADYERADALQAKARGLVTRLGVRPHWFAGGGRFWYRNDLKGGAREYFDVDAARGERRPAFESSKLAEALTKHLGRPVPADQLQIDVTAVEDDGAIRFDFLEKSWRFDPGQEQLAEFARSKPVQDSSPSERRRRSLSGSVRGEESPDGRWVAFVKDHNLNLRRKSNGEEFALSNEGTEGDGYEPGVFWSPDSTRCVALRRAKGDERKVTVVESSPGGRVQPLVQTFDYLKPGDRVAVSRPHLFSVADRAEVTIADDQAPNPWSISEVRWAPDSSRFTFLYNQRGHQTLRLVGVDATTGQARPIIVEQSKTFVDYANKYFCRILDRSHEILWMSERDGWNHLYLIDAENGEVKNQITQGEWVVRGVDLVDEETRTIWFRALGIRPGQDPYYVHHARVNFDGSGLVVLTEGDGTHEVEFSPDRRYLIDTYSRVDLPPITELRRADDGALVMELERADASALRAGGWRAPERFAAKGRDGETEIFGVIYRPANHDPRAKYPVIEQIYAGPHGAFVPKKFESYHRPQSLAELGFIVVQIDGMGTNWRSRAFHDVCWKNLGDAGFPDRIAWLKAAAEADPSLDLSRVGIYGGSAGGQNALRALLAHGDFYKVGAADCGCHDNRMDKIWWNELWMGWPVGPHYAEQSNVTNAHKLQGKLLLTVGELDHNVDPASTMQVVNALIAADKDFELIVFPGADHGAGGSRYGERRRRDFFVRHLLGVEPRRDSR